jgi:sugar lactone lactonase YvrE
MLVSDRTAMSVRRVTPDGEVTTVAADVPWPGELRVRGPIVYVPTGDSPHAGVLGTTDGTIDRVDLRTGARSTWARGLAMPNGLAFVPGGDAVVSRTSGPAPVNPTGITRVPRSDPERPEYGWADLVDTNGLAVDPSGEWLYTVQTWTFDSAVFRVRVRDPSRIERIAELSGGTSRPKALDDIAIDDGTGRLYLAANGTGEVIELDPGADRWCAVATGLTNPSAVAFGGGMGWPAGRLYVASWDGTVKELTPP